MLWLEDVVGFHVDEQEIYISTEEVAVDLRHKVKILCVLDQEFLIVQHLELFFIIIAVLDIHFVEVGAHCKVLQRKLRHGKVRDDFPWVQILVSCLVHGDLQLDGLAWLLYNM